MCLRKFATVAGLVAVIALTGAGALYAAGQSLLSNLEATLTGFEVLQDVASGGVPRYFHPSGLLYTTILPVSSSAATTEQTLASFNLPVSKLTVNGQRLRVRAAFTAAANSNNKTFKCYFGAEVISSGVLTTNGLNGSCEIDVVRTGPNTQYVWANMLVDTTAITGVSGAGAETETGLIPIKFTATDGSASAGDIVLQDFYVEQLN